MVDVVVNEVLVQKVAQNARLKLTEEELKKFTPQIREIILKAFNKLDEIIAEEEPSFQPIEQKNKLREDIPKKGFSQEEALENVKIDLRDLGYIKGPKVV
ncbi:MAG: Asp-tRNA(Asn)/Glu-tRNA(Gln) amidotransferase subunit GatC [Candidatus ainarchaeum sp.]|nr:Asp-tRNA(Asn)/Glu-tRNA(Gln) amidotransferase subunit GatC [Candidatus ainarchaeum sp.]